MKSEFGGAVAEYFTDIGNEIGRSWTACDRLESAFPSLALAALTQRPPSEFISLNSLVRWALSVESLPEQVDLRAAFGQPPLTLYRGGGFRIEALFWTDGVPDIHQHAFSGAFHVLEGSSLHTLWKFSPHCRFNSRLVGGDLRIAGVELLACGATRQIFAGPEYIHATFHLDRPSVTIVVRTNSEPGALPQYTYLRPGLAFSEDPEDATAKRRIQLLRMLAKAGKLDEFHAHVTSVLRQGDAFYLFQVLREAFKAGIEASKLDALFQQCSRKHRPLLEILLPVMHAERRTEVIKALRRRTNQADVQFFLALMLNIPNRASVLDMVAARYPGQEPVVKLSELCSKVVDGKVMSPLDDPTRTALELVIRDGSSELLDASQAAGLEQLRQFKVFDPILSS